MKKLLQINVEATYLSTGRIADGIGDVVLNDGWESHIAFGRRTGDGNSIMYQIGTKLDSYIHALDTRLTGRHGESSYRATKKFIDYIEQVQPNIIQLHNLHGYYLHLELFFNYLNLSKIPVVWSLHDLWAITGHCTQFEHVNCTKWKNECYKCPQLNEYPKSLFFDRSTKNHRLKKRLFTQREQLQLVTSSNWSQTKITESYLKNYPLEIIANGVDMSIFYPREYTYSYPMLQDKHVLLGVAGVWTDLKGYSDFLKFSQQLKHDEILVMVGLTKDQIKGLPINILGLERTRNTKELSELYSIADAFLNLTYADTFPTTNLEALACGTPTITYNTGGSIESVFKNSGKVINQGDLKALRYAVDELKLKSKAYYREQCYSIAKQHFEKITQFEKYKTLYDSLI